MIGNVIANGIGSPADIPHNILFGLSPNPNPAPPTPPSTQGGGYPITAPPRSSRALLNRDYREKAPPKRITRIDTTITADGVVAYARVGVARASGTITAPPIVAPPVDPARNASVRADTVLAIARIGRTDRVNAVARTTGKRRMSADEWFLMGFVAGQADGD